MYHQEIDGETVDLIPATNINRTSDLQKYAFEKGKIGVMDPKLSN